MTSASTAPALATAHRRHAAILAADIVGFSRLMEADEEGTYARLTELRARILEPQIAEHGGELVKSTGDGFLAIFDGARAAARSALAIQRAVRAWNPQEPEHRAIALRMGINVADVILEKGDVYGDGVNIAARMQTYAEPGGVVVTGAVAEQIEPDAGVRIIDLGDLHLRNLNRPVRAYSLRIGEAGAAGIADAPVQFGGRPSIVVLPFRKNQTDVADGYFADGIVDDIIYALSGLKDLFVISRGSTLGYGGASVDVRTIGRELGVRYVLYGSVRRSGGRLRIGTELSDAESGSIVFTDQYDGALDDLFELQNRITARVITTIAPHVRDRERLRAMRKHPQNLTAYDLVLQALDSLYQMDYESFSRARGLLQQAMVHDPGYAPAYSYAAYWHMFRVGQGWSPDPAGDAEEAAHAAAAAVERDANDALALAISGHMHSYLRRDFETGAQLLDRAISVGPNCAMAWTLSSCTCGYLGEGATAVLRAEHGLRLSPLDSHVYWHEHVLAQAHYINGNYDDAVTWGRKATVHNGRLTSNLRCLAASLVAIGKIDEAREVARQALAVEPRFGIKSFEARTPLQGAVRAGFVERLRAAGLPD